jgi:hypothetical protein
MSAAIGLILRESASILRERSFTIERAQQIRDIESILALLKAERASGQVVINLSQGGISTIHFEETRRI